MAFSTLYLLAFAACFSLAVCNVCSVNRNGQLTMFNGETHYLRFPCKAVVADYTCGIYRAKVTMGSEFELTTGGSRFTPRTVWVKLINTNNDNQYIATTDRSKLRDAIAGTNGVTNPWKNITNGMSNVNVDLVNNVATLSKANIVVEFRETKTSGVNAGVTVKCNSANFVPKSLPDSLCGDGQTSDALTSYRQDKFGFNNNVSQSEALQYIALGDSSLTTNQRCPELAGKFQTDCSASEQEQAVQDCGPIFNDEPLRTCLNDYPASGDIEGVERSYFQCLKYVCEQKQGGINNVRNFIQNKSGCEGNLSKLPGGSK